MPQVGLFAKDSSPDLSNFVNTTQFGNRTQIRAQSKKTISEFCIASG